MLLLGSNGSGPVAHCGNYSVDLLPCGLEGGGSSCSATFQSVASNFLVNLLTFSGMLLAFVVLHCFPTWARVLSPLRETPSRCASLSSLPFSPLGCCKDDDEARARISIDGWVLIRFCRVGLAYSILSVAIGCALVPIYADADVSSGHRPEPLDSVQRYTITGLDDQEWKVWAVVASAYALAVGFCLLMVREWRAYVAMRRDHFVARARGELGLEAAQAQFSLMVERVPPVHQSDERLREAFGRVFASVHSAVLLTDTAHKYDALLLRQGSCACCCTCARRRYESGLERLMRLSEGARRNMRYAHSVLTELRAPGGLTSTGFVTLASVADQQVALQQVSLFRARSTPGISFADYVLRPAPEARDVVWRNAGLSHSAELWRCKLGGLLCLVGVLLWSFLLFAVQTATSRASVEAHLPAVAEPLSRSAFVYRLLLEEGYLSVAAIQGLLLLLPYALEALSLRLEGRKQRTTVARKVLVRNLSFQLASLYFMVLGGFVARDVRGLWEVPVLCTVERYGRQFPQVAVYFINFVMMRAGLSLPLLLLRPYALFCGFTCWVSSGEYDEPVHCWFGYEAANLVIVLFVANMYVVIAPFVAVLCVLYFALAICVYNYLFRYVYTPEFDCQGRFWEELFHGAMWGLWLGALTVTGIVTTKSNRALAAMAVLLLLILLFYRQTAKFYGRRSKFMPFEEAISIDRGPGPELVGRFSDTCYLDPVEKLHLSGVLEEPATDDCESTDRENSSSESTATEDLAAPSSEEEATDGAEDPETARGEGV